MKVLTAYLLINVAIAVMGIVHYQLLLLLETPLEDFEDEN